MTYKVQGRRTKKHQVPIDIKQTSWPKGYISTYANSRRDRESLSDMTNMELVQDNIVRPRPPLVRYGTQPAYTVIGRGSYRYSGSRSQLFMMNVAGVGKVYRQTDGGAFTVIGGANAYDPAAWAGFRQTKDRVYVYNGVDNLSYIDLATMATVEYTALATPAAPTGTAAAGLTSGTKPFNYYYKVTANNAVGESTASAASTAVNVNTIRDNWTAANSVTVTWSSVAGATSYTIYGGDDPNFLNEIVTLANLATLSFTDGGELTLNPFKTAPASNSTEGAVFNWMYVDTKDATIYGVTSTNQVYYSAAGTGDFSSLNGGGFATIDEGGDSQVNFIDGFRTGKGDPVISIFARGAAGKGKLYHMTFSTATYGDQVLTFPDITEANGQAGTYAPRATVKSRDSLIYPAGDSFKSTGTSQNIVNILTTNSISQGIIPDVDNINLDALDGAAGVEYQDKVYFTLPVGSATNNQIWYVDQARKNAWVLRWPVNADDIWLYEDNAGSSHLCVLVGNVIMEFTRAGSSTTSDDGVAWSSRVAFSSLVWDESGISLGKIHNQYFKLLSPRGEATANTYGLTKRGSTTDTGSDSFSSNVSFTGYDIWDYDSGLVSQWYDADPGNIDLLSQSVAILHVRPKGLLNQEDWEVVTSEINCDYYLSSVTTRGTANLDLIYAGIG